MDMGLDSERVKQLIEVWAAKGMMNQEEAQSGSQIKAQNNLAAISRASDQMENIMAEKRIRASSRTNKKATWFDDYI